jgi:hypothetical protein
MLSYDTIAERKLDERCALRAGGAARPGATNAFRITAASATARSRGVGDTAVRDAAVTGPSSCA